MNPDVIDQKLELLEKKLFSNPKMLGLSGDIGDEKTKTFLKTMSDGGGYDKEMADTFESWLKENNIEYSRNDYRHFHVNTSQLFEALEKLS